MHTLDPDSTWTTIAQRAGHAERIEVQINHVLARFKEHIEFLAARNFTASISTDLAGGDRAVITFVGITIRVVESIWADGNSSCGALDFYVAPATPDLFKPKKIGRLDVDSGGAHAFSSGGVEFKVDRYTNLISVLLQILKDAQEVRFAPI